MGNPAISLEDGGSCVECRHFLGARSHPVHGTYVVCKPCGGYFWGNAATGCRYWERSEDSPHDPQAGEPEAQPE